MKSIALIGFMACGKSTLGRILAHEMNYSFIDTDTQVEKKEGRKISEIFDSDGEDYFRRIESDTLRECSSRKRAVLSTGGGIVARPENIAILKENSFVVFLDVPFDILAERATGSGRPLFRDRDAAFQLWKKRYELYRSTADMVYDKSNEIILKSARHIMSAYYNKMKKYK